MGFRTVISIWAFILSAAAARADVLYWMIDADVYREEFAFVSLNAEGAGEPIELAELQPGGVPYLLETPVDGFASDGVSFYIELYNGEQNPLCRSTGVPVGYLRDYIGTTSAARPKAYFSSWEFQDGPEPGRTPQHAVPEPTSGLLVAVGMALLGLRRRTVRRI